MADETIESAIESNATGPRRASDDNGSFEQHPLQDQISADKYLRNKSAASKGIGLRHVRMVPPSATGE